MKLTAITTYFNPLRYRTRLTNYRVFRRFLGVPLIAVEWSQSGSFELALGDADLVIHIAGGDLMWQKERLLNIALDHLPADCDYVASVDCDVVFESPRWANAVTEALKRVALAHPYEERVDLARNAQPPGHQEEDCLLRTPSEVLLVNQGLSDPASLGSPGGVVRVNRAATGLAWAARRELLEATGFYDCCVAGSGNRALISAAFGRHDTVRTAFPLSPAHWEHFRPWAERFHREIRGQVGTVHGRVMHLWHGDLSNRWYNRRHLWLADAEFDPETDIQINAAGLWRWSSDKTSMHAQVAQLFALRKEDGEAAAPV